MASETERLLDLFRRTHAGDPWHGPSLMDALADVTAVMAASHPVIAGHSIWEIVLHITGWRGEVVRRLGGGAAATPQEGDWPKVPDATEENWQRALAALDASHRAVIDAVNALADSRLETPVVDYRDRAMGTGLSYAVTLHGLIHHDVYHTGQISLLKRAALGASV
jgi:uncharacterized damage-inducible protein DinB